MVIEDLKTITMNGGGRYAKNSMRIIFFFFWLILGYSLVITACGGCEGGAA